MTIYIIFEEIGEWNTYELRLVGVFDNINMASGVKDRMIAEKRYVMMHSLEMNKEYDTTYDHINVKTANEQNMNNIIYMKSLQATNDVTSTVCKS